MQVTIKSILIDDVQPVKCPNCGSNSGLELEGAMYFCDCGYMGGKDSIQPVDRSVRFTVYEEKYKDQQFSIKGAVVEDFFNEKLENKKLLAKKMVESKVRITADVSLVVSKIERL